MKVAGMEVLSPSPHLSKPSYLTSATTNNVWTQAENKMFENLLAVYDKDTPDRWQKVAEMIPGKTIEDVIRQYKELEDDVSSIEAGLVPIPPGYTDNNTFNTNLPFGLEWVNNNYGNYGFDALNYDKQNYFYGKRGGTRPCEQERKKGVPWTEEEHKLFLMGLKKYGKGDWRNISRNYVVSRTPTQVASHAQKYFIRQLSGGGSKDKRRASIHDITTVNLDMNLPLHSPSQSHSPPAADNNHKSSNLQLPPPPTLDEQQQSTTSIGFSQNHLVGSTLLPPYGFNPNGYAIKLENLQQQYHVDGSPSMGFQMQQHYSYR